MDKHDLKSTPNRNNIEDDKVIRSNSTSTTPSFGRKKAMSVSLTMTPKGYKMNNPHKTPTSTPKITKAPSTVGTHVSSKAMNRRSMILSRSDVNNALKFTLYISENLILKKSGEKNLKSVKTLAINNREGSIKTIEGLDKCVELEVLDLHGHQIDKIRNLNMLTKLTNLNLANNMIRMIEGLDKLENLRVLNLAKNLIKTIPTSIKHLVSLQELRLNNNIIDNLKSIKALRRLANLHYLTISSNPLCDIPHYFLYIVYQVPTLSQLDDNEIDDSIRNEAKERFYKEEMDELEQKVIKMTKENKELKEKYEQTSTTLEQLSDDYQKSQFEVENLRKENETFKVDLNTKTKLLDKKTEELIHVSEILYQIQQQLAFYNIDNQFDVSHIQEILKGYNGKDLNVTESPYIGKSYFEKLKMNQSEVSEPSSISQNDKELLYKHKIIHQRLKTLKNDKDNILNDKLSIQNSLNELDDKIEEYNNNLLQEDVNPFEIQRDIESLYQEKALKKLKLDEIENMINELERKIIWLQSKRDLLSKLDEDIDLDQLQLENDKDFLIESLKFDLEERDMDIKYMNKNHKTSQNTQISVDNSTYNALVELEERHINMVKNMIQHFDKNESNPTSMDETCHTGTCNIINTLEELSNRPTDDDIAILHHLKVTNFYSIEEDDDENKTNLGIKLRNQAIFLYHQLSRKVNQIKELKSQGFLKDVI